MLSSIEMTSKEERIIVQSRNTDYIRLHYTPGTHVPPGGIDVTAGKHAQYKLYVSDPLSVVLGTVVELYTPYTSPSLEWN
jgi:hypothetical protein